MKKTGANRKQKFVQADNPGQKYLEQSKEIKQNWTRAESFVTALRDFWLLLQKFYFWKKDWLLGSTSTQCGHFCNIS